MARHGVQARWRSLLPGMVIIFGEQGPWEADDGLQHWAWLANGEDAIAVVFYVLKSKGLKGLRKNEKDAISIVEIAEKCLTTLKNSHPPQQSYRDISGKYFVTASWSKQHMGIPRYVMIQRFPGSSVGHVAHTQRPQMRQWWRSLSRPYCNFSFPFWSTWPVMYPTFTYPWMDFVTLSL